jgi:hypothetical protein
MRYLGILGLTLALASPALARKHHSGKRPAHASRQKLPPPPPVEPSPPIARAETPPPPPVSASAQLDDDEVPGKKHKK